MKDETNVDGEQMKLFEMMSFKDPETSEIVAWVIFPISSEEQKNVAT